MPTDLQSPTKTEFISVHLPTSLPLSRIALTSPVPHPRMLLSRCIVFATHVYIAFARSKSPLVLPIISSAFALTTPSVGMCEVGFKNSKTAGSTFSFGSKFTLLKSVLRSVVWILNWIFKIGLCSFSSNSPYIVGISVSEI